MHLRSSHFRQGHYKARHFGGVIGEVVQIVVELAGPIKKVKPVFAFKKIKPVMEIKHGN